MAPKTEKQSFKKSSSYMKPHSVLSEKFKPLYYNFASGSQGSTSDPNPPILKHPSSPVVEEGNISGSLPLVEEPIPLNLSTFDTNPLSVHKSICDLQDRCRTLEKKLEIANFHKKDISQAPFSPLEIGEKKPFTPLVDEKLSKDEQECIIFRMFHRRSELLSTLKPADLYQLICEKAKSSAEEKQIFISAYL